jgi:ankyrin repeat protein
MPATQKLGFSSKELLNGSHLLASLCLLSALAEAISIDEGVNHLDADDIKDESAILHWCSSLIRKSASQKEVELSHFTVKEFLMDINAETQSAFLRYRLRPETEDSELAKTSLTYLCLDNFSESYPETYDQYTEHDGNYPFRPYAAQHWSSHARGHFSEEYLSKLTRKLFHPSKSNNFMSWAQQLFIITEGRRESDAIKFEDILPVVRDSTVLHWACMLSLPQTCKWLLENGLDVNKSSSLGSPLHCAILSLEILECVHERNYVPYFMSIPKEVSKDLMEVLQLILAAGADPNCSFALKAKLQGSVHATPLYLASQIESRDSIYDPEEGKKEHFAIVATLLNAGAICDELFLKHVIDNQIRYRYSDEEDLRPERDESVDGLTSQLILATSQSSSIPEFQSITRQAAPKKMQSEECKRLLTLAAGSGQIDAVKNLLSTYEIDLNTTQDERGQGALHWAAKNGFPEVIEVLVAAGADVNQTDLRDETALHLASKRNDSKSVEFLLTNGAAIDCVSEEGLKPIHVAALSKSVANVRILAQVTQNPDLHDASVTSDGRTIFLCAAQGGSLEVIQFVLENVSTSSLNERCQLGFSHLHYAAESGSIPAIKFLIESGLDPNDPSVDGSTALHIAIARCSPNSLYLTPPVVSLLLSANADVNKKRNDGKTSLHLLCSPTSFSSESIKVLDLLVKDGVGMVEQDLDGNTPLHILCKVPSENEYPYYGSWASYLVEKMLKHGAKLQVKDAEGKSVIQRAFETWCILSVRNPDSTTGFAGNILLELLDHATADDVMNMEFKGRQPLCMGLMFQEVDLVESLLKILPDVDKKDRDDGKLTPLEESCITGCTSDLFERLLVMSRDRFELHKTKGRNLLHRASAAGHVNLVNVLLANGFELSDRTVDGETPLMLAASRGQVEVIETLLSAGAQGSDKDNRGWTPLHHACRSSKIDAVRLLGPENCVTSATASIDIGGTVIRQINALHVAAMTGNDEIVQFFLSENPSINVDCLAGEKITPLHLAAWYSHAGVVSLLLAKGAQIDGKELLNYTPLHFAALSGSEAVVRILLEGGANVELSEKRGFLPEHLALEKGHTKIASMIQEHRSLKGIIIITACNILLNCHTASLRTQETQSELTEGERLAVSKAQVNGLTKPMFLAIELGNLDLCARLLDQGVDVNETDVCCRGCTALVKALHHQKLDIAKLLIEKGARNSGQVCSRYPTRGYGPMHYAASYGNIDIVKLILGRDPFYACRTPIHPIHLAAAGGHKNCLKLLLEHDESLHMLEANDETPLKCLTSRDGEQGMLSPGGKRVVRTAVLQGRKYPLPDPQVSKLIDIAVDVREMTWNWGLMAGTPCDAPTGETPLAMASRCGEEAAAYLLQRGANIEGCGTLGETALHCAAAQGSISLVKMLIAAGANVDSRMIGGVTPAMLAARDGHVQVLAELARKNANMAARDTGKKHALHFAARNDRIGSLKCLMALGQRMDLCDVTGYSPIHCALGSANLEVVNFAVDFAPNVSMESSEHGTLLNFACHNENPGGLRRLLARARKEGHLACLINKSSETFPTPLYDAASEGLTDHITLLLDAGADIGALWKEHGTPLGVACARGRLAAVKLLIEKGAKRSWTGKEGNPDSASSQSKKYKHVVKWLEETFPEREDAVCTPIISATSNGETEYRVEVGKRLLSCREGTEKTTRYAARRRNSLTFDYVFYDQLIPPSQSESADSTTSPATDKEQSNGKSVIQRTDVRTPEDFDALQIHNRDVELFELFVGPSPDFHLEAWLENHRLAPFITRDGPKKPWVIF